MNTKIARVGVAAAALALTLSACGGGGGSNASGGGEVDPDGTLNVGYTLPAMPLDPHKPTSDIALYTYGALVFDRLTKIDYGMKLTPMLAKSWTFAEDGMSVDFVLEDDVTFSDGATLDADAVKASLDRAAFDPESTVSGRLAMIEKVEVVDPGTVRIHTKRKAADLPFALAGMAGAIISPQAINNKDLDVKPVGSGPYVVTDLTLGESASYERRDDYWGPEEGLPKVIKVTGFSDESARLNAMRSGQIDMAPVNITHSDQGEKLGGNTELHRYPASTVWSLFLNSNTEALSDPKVRQALNYAIDREALDKSLLKGNCAPTSQLIAEGQAGHLDPAPVEYAYDPAKAKELLAEAGYPNGFKGRMLFSQGLSVHEALGTAILAQLAEVGVDLEVVKADPTQAPAMYAAESYETYMQTRTVTADPAMTLAQNFSAPRFPGPIPKEFTAALEVANDPNLDEAAVTEALETASGISNEQAFDLFVCTYPTLIAGTTGISGEEKMGSAFYTGTLDLRAVSVLK